MFPLSFSTDVLLLAQDGWKNLFSTLQAVCAEGNHAHQDRPRLVGIRELEENCFPLPV